MTKTAKSNPAVVDSLPASADVPASLAAIRAAFEAVPVPTERMAVPELGGLEVELRGLNAPARAEMFAACYRTVTDEDGQPVLGADGKEETEAIYPVLYPFLMTRGVFDPASGCAVFTADDVAFLNTRDPAVVERFAGAVLRLSGLGKKSMETEKNGSATTGSTASGSTSPDSSTAPSLNSTPASVA